MNVARRIYVRLARAFPHEFRMAYGPELMQVGDDVVEEIARKRGIAGLIWLIADIAVRVPLEYLEEMRRDLRYSLRAMVKSPGFALVAVISMGLGMGLTTVVYSSKWRAITRELPAENAGRLAMIEKPVSYPFDRNRSRQGEIRSVALAAQPPFAMEDEDATVPVTAEDPSGGTRVQFSVLQQTIGTGYFAALDERMLAGREFTDSDQRIEPSASTNIPIILDERTARRLGGPQNAIGKHVRQGQQSYEVVGVVRNLDDNLGNRQSLIYLPLTPHSFAQPPADGITIMVRSDAGDALASIRQQIASIDPNLIIFNARTLSAYLDLSRTARRFAINTYGGMGLFGLLLAAVGLAGVTAYAVAQRRKEIGIRMALGARKGQVLLLVLREATALVTAGTVLGFLGAFALARGLSSLTSTFTDALNVGTDDPRLHIGAPLLLGSLAIIASYIPARKAAQIDPLTALRED